MSIFPCFGSESEPVLFDVVFAYEPVIDYRDVVRGHAKRFNQHLREQGILKPESKFYISLALDDHDLAQTIKAITARYGIDEGSLLKSE